MLLESGRDAFGDKLDMVSIKQAVTFVLDRTSVFRRYTLVGVFSFLFNLVFTGMLTELVKLNYLASFVISLSITTACGFILSSRYVFRNRKISAQRFIQYMVSLAAFYSLNIACVHLLAGIIGLHYLIAISITIFTLHFVKYFVYKSLVFNVSK